MDILEAKQDAAYRESERRGREAAVEWNEQVKKGAIVKGTFFKTEEFKEGKDIQFDGPTTSEAYYEFPMGAVVDVKGVRKVPLHALQSYFKTSAYRF